MSREIECRRHSIKLRGRIGPDGHAFARAVGARQLRGRGFTAFYASHLWRTHQTLAAFDEGAGDFALYFTPVPYEFFLDWPELRDLWQGCHAASKRGEDMLLAAFSLDRKLSEHAAKEGARKFRQWVARLPEDAKVLLVGHSPYLELVLYGLTGHVIPALKECQGFRIHEENGTFRADWESPDLNPADIRRELFPEAA